MSARLFCFFSAAFAERCLLCGALLGLGCSSGPLSVGDDRVIDAGLTDSGVNDTTPTDATAAQLLALIAPCMQISTGLLAPAPGRTADVQVCGLSNAVFWTSELAVDCDGKTTTICNRQQDPQYNASTVGKDSMGNSLDASLVPYVEVPAQSTIFDYHAAGISMGSVAVVIYKDRLAYGVIGHEQASDVIGAASYAMAELLGIDPNPVTGGLETEDVTYFAFTGTSNVVPALEDETAATQLAKAAAAELVATGH
ncbi:MAG TPA: glycoside hydrolase family 75 protein [Polyangiaceae bacterium]|jgi:hypothetical protein|nr:glycoside hydrolase family 75 protein [Polyangiaceae bacterium]